ncbi:TPA: InlB B-repeat-containing protein [Streptococcus suis]|uniref:InlB B-repeat-containing protein n=1 Tax=Streptococcus suis TaxID=1307 RepID=UPI0005CCC4A0|nr:InlB B-repeat-containing protein [Streptococcus suis]MCQ9223396.1 InlB B-repeat-containing protein [Streptococcus suis]MCQ9230079.1 InlB B-repeat-containing protein [Streptococcus suis]MDW8575811.1 InlB B-repeat-containing protein [Streptococcus suis]MDW8589887.1 InlB B-repeat-containing protein [Streptococcus suis]MDW8615744.1 InlB B-repeat-containing protein [Streptococcus suis]
MKKCLYFLTIAALSLNLVACTQASQEANSTNSVVSEASNYKVTYYDSDGTTVLKTEQVKSTGDILKYIPSKEGKTFVGWYVKPDFSRKFTESSNITSDLSLYAGFSAYKEDTRSFIVVGNGNSEILKESNWGANVSDKHKLIKEESNESNIYSITMNLEEGDEFQFAINSSWENQRGFGYLETIEKDGVTYFENSGGLGETSSKRSNIKIAKSGTYTFTLITHPAEDTYDTENSEYSEAKKESFNINNFDTIAWTYEN